MWETPSVAPSNLCCALPLCLSILSISFLSFKWFKNSKFSRVHLEESRQRGTLDCKRALTIADICNRSEIDLSAFRSKNIDRLKKLVVFREGVVNISFFFYLQTQVFTVHAGFIAI